MAGFVAFFCLFYGDFMLRTIREALGVRARVEWYLRSKTDQRPAISPAS